MGATAQIQMRCKIKGCGNKAESLWGITSVCNHHYNQYVRRKLEIAQEHHDRLIQKRIQIEKQKGGVATNGISKCRTRSLET